MVLIGIGATILASCVASAEGLSLGRPQDRADRLISISGERPEALTAEYSHGNAQWNPASIYVGATVDEWQTTDPAVWNGAANEGLLPAGEQTCVWNWVFDAAAAPVEFRLTDADGEVVLAEMLDLAGARDVLVIDAENARDLAGGALSEPWTIDDGSIFCPVDDPMAPPLVLNPDLNGWHRIYIGMEAASALQVSLSGEQIAYPVPDYMKSSEAQKRGRREYYISSADMTGQSVSLMLGGTVPKWHDARIRHVRFVPMTKPEIRHFRQVRKMAEKRGRPFAGYVEQCTAGAYEPSNLTLLAHTRNEMRLNKARGASEVYVHVIRTGVKAWCHSDIVERCIPSPGETSDHWVKVGKWIEQGDPLQIAVEEARAVGLRILPDMGMNVTYITKDPDYNGLAEAFSLENPEYLVPGHSMFLDYRHEAVRDYVVAIARELMTNYDVDGINLDFARFGHNLAYDEASLVDVVQRIDQARQDAEAKWGHSLTIATRIPSYMYSTDADWAQAIYGGEHAWFTAALKTWANSGWIDRVMLCCSVPAKQAKLSLERYTDAIEGTDVEMWGDLYGPGGRSRQACLEQARGWADQGLDGGFFFYAVNRLAEFGQINWMLRLIDFPDVTVED